MNEAAGLAEAMAVLRARTAGRPVEVIVADCASVDDTAAIARKCGALLRSGPSVVSRDPVDVGVRLAERLRLPP